MVGHIFLWNVVAQKYNVALKSKVKYKHWECVYQYSTQVNVLSYISSLMYLLDAKCEDVLSSHIIREMFPSGSPSQT